MADDDVAELQAKLEQALDSARTAEADAQAWQIRAYAAESALAAAQGALRRWEALHEGHTIECEEAHHGNPPSACICALAAESGKPGGQEVQTASRRGGKTEALKQAVREHVARHPDAVVAWATPQAGPDRPWHPPDAHAEPRAAPPAPRHVHDGSLKCSCGAIGPFDAPKAPPALPAELSGKGEQR